MEKKKKKLGLLPKLLIAIVLGLVIGTICQKIGSAGELIIQIGATYNSIFGNFLNFCIPLIIIGFVVPGIADLGTGAGKTLAATTGVAYLSTIIAGSLAFAVDMALFPSLVHADMFMADAQNAEETALTGLFTIEMPPIMGVMEALLISFILGLGLTLIKNDTLKLAIKDFSEIVTKLVGGVVIPLLPFHVYGIFAKLTYAGTIVELMTSFIKVFAVILCLHVIILVFQYTVAGTTAKKNPFSLIKNMIPAYTTAIGTQSSAATIPVNLQCAEADGISQEIRNFVVPLCANIHMAGSMITITACATAVCLMNQLPISLATVVPFIMTLGVAMVASPGAPGGSIMTALPFLYMIFGAEAGDPNGPICAIMVALYITQDSFGTACNVSGDNAIGIIVDTINRKLSKA